MTFNELSIDSQTATGSLRVSKKIQHEPLSECVRQAMEYYYERLDGHPPKDLYHMVISEIERPLLQCVLDHSGGNQSRAAAALGISRSTLRKKLAQYEID